MSSVECSMSAVDLSGCMQSQGRLRRLGYHVKGPGSYICKKGGGGQSVLLSCRPSN